MTEKFNLSEKECNILVTKIDLDKPVKANFLTTDEYDFEKGYFKEDVRTFIKKLKEKTQSWPDGYDAKSHKFRDLIDTLAGKELSK